MDPAHWPLALPPGTEIDQYRIRKVLGKGGFGITYLAYDTVLQCLVALKELLPDGIATRAQGEVCPLAETRREDFIWSKRTFLSEARHLAQFNHPHIVHVRRVFEGNGTAYLVMDYLSGPSLEDHLRSSGPPSLDLVMSWMEALLDALEAVHRSGLIHGDVKPFNIILAEPDQRPVLLDFGTSRQSMEETATVTTVVSAGYAPFEQYLSRTKLTAATDLYSLGATLYRAISGGRPDEATARAGKADPYVPLLGSAHEQTYGSDLCAAVDRMLALWPDDRPQSVEEFRRILREGAPAHGATVVGAGDQGRRGSPHPARSVSRGPVLLGLACALLVAAGGGTVWYARRPDQARWVAREEIRLKVAERLIQASAAPDLDAARRHLEAALDLDPLNKDARDRLAEVERELERVAQEAAAKLAETASRQAQVAAWMEEGNAALSSGQWDRARTAFDDVLRLSPGHAAAVSGRERAQREIEEVARVRSEEQQRRQQIETACALGRKLKSEGQLDLAESAFQRALALDPSSPEALDGLREVSSERLRLAAAAAEARRRAEPPPRPAASTRLIADIEASSTLRPQTDKGQLIRYGAGNLIDGSISQTWVEGATGDGVGEGFRVTFKQTVRLSRIHVFAGYGKNEEVFLKNSRVTEFALRTSAGHRYTLRCADRMAYNSFDLDPPVEVDWVHFEIRAVNRGSKFDDACVSEVMFE
jgi:tetratricopeptide (TPR) repeat protein